MVTVAAISQRVAYRKIVDDWYVVSSDLRVCALRDTHAWIWEMLVKNAPIETDQIGRLLEMAAASEDPQACKRGWLSLRHLLKHGLVEIVNLRPDEVAPGGAR
jgi:hypothetical protein